MSEFPPEAEQFQKDKKRVEERTTIGAHVVYYAIMEEGTAEVERSSQALAWSALAAGLAMGFSLIAQGALETRLPEAEWAFLISKFGYAVGFVLVILGRKQLFTENTLVPIIPLLDSASAVQLHHVLRLWGVVLAANLVGATLFAFAVAYLPFFPADMHDAFRHIGLAPFKHGPLEMFVGAIYAGWLIALIPWLMPAAEGSKLLVIVLITYLIGIAGLPHIIAGSVDTMYVVAVGSIPFSQYLLNFMLPTLIGNTVGGLTLAAGLNYAQVAAGHQRHEYTPDKVIVEPRSH